MQIQSLGLEDPLEESMVTTLVFLPEESHGQRRLVGYSPWGHKESDTDTTEAPSRAQTYAGAFVANNSNRCTRVEPCTYRAKGQ